MSQSNTQRNLATWKSVCNETDLVSNSGVVVWLDGAQVALFYLPDAQDQTLYAIDNHDPESGANVIGRGLVGSIKGDLVVAAPGVGACLVVGRRSEGGGAGAVAGAWTGAVLPVPGLAP